MKFVKFLSGFVFISGLATSGVLADDSFRVEVGRGGSAQLDRIEDKLDDLLRSNERIEQRLRRLGSGGNNGGPREIVSSVDVACVEDLMHFTYSAEQRRSILDSCRTTPVDKLVDVCLLVSRVRNEECFNEVNYFSYTAAQKADLMEGCQTYTFDCR